MKAPSLHRLVVSATLASALALVAAPRAAWGWGALGHRLVAETAALLLEDRLPKGWGPIFARHRVELGYYSYYPDSIYRHKDATGKLEGGTHYFDLDVLPAKERANLPSSYAKARARLEPLAKAGFAFEKLGSSPWRVDQFFRLATRELEGLERVEGIFQRGTTATGDAHKVFRAMYYLGVMSHYTGDAIMPYHASTDFNGWGTGQGGIHFYFENDCVNELEPGLSEAVLKSARKNGERWLKEWNARAREPASLMGAVLEDSLAAIRKVAAVDIKNAVIRKSTKAFSSDPKDSAVRKPASQACPSFRPLLIERLAKGAVLTVHLWIEALPRGFDSTASASLQFSDFEFNPDFIAPDYMTQAAPPSGAPLSEDGH